MTAENISTQELLASLGTGVELGSLKRLLNQVGDIQAVDDSIPEAQLKRQQRKQNKDAALTGLKKFEPQVKQNRRKEQINFSEMEGGNGVAKQTSITSLTQSLVPSNDFETEFRQAMEESGLSWNCQQSGQILPNPEIEEHRERSQKARIRTLLRAEQIRSRRLKKIKSKTYRRLIRKKEMKGVQDLIAKLDKDDPNASEEIRAELEKKLSGLRLNRQRQARLKWSQAAQRFGGREIRTEISRQAQADQDERRELIRAVKGKDENNSSSDDMTSDSDSGSDCSDDDDVVAKVKKAIDKNVVNMSNDEPASGLMGMKFMRAAASKRKTETVAEATSFLKALSDSSSDSEDSSAPSEDGEEDNASPTDLSLQQEDLVASLFSAPVEVRPSQKPATMAYKLRDSAKDEPDQIPGWGAWIGEGVKERKKKMPPVKTPSKTKTTAVMTMASEEVVKAPLMKYQVKEVPYPYQTRADYEKAMAEPLGPEWQSLSSHAECVKPQITARLGAVIPRLTHVRNLESDKRAKIIDAWDNRKKTQHTKARFA